MLPGLVCVASRRCGLAHQHRVSRARAPGVMAGFDNMKLRRGLTVSIWFDGESDIDCTLHQVKRAFDNHGEHYVGVTSLMPGLTTVELVDQGSDSVTIRTNEGVIDRTNIAKRIEADRVIVDFEEQYAAGSRITVTSHFSDEFTTSSSGVTHRVVISDVEAPGFLASSTGGLAAPKRGMLS